MWRIAMKPGRPLAFGRVRGGGREAAFMGLPGNPVSSFVTFTGVFTSESYIINRLVSPSES